MSPKRVAKGFGYRSGPGAVDTALRSAKAESEYQQRSEAVGSGRTGDWFMGNPTDLPGPKAPTAQFARDVMTETEGGRSGRKGGASRRGGRGLPKY